MTTPTTPGTGDGKTLGDELPPLLSERLHVLFNDARNDAQTAGSHDYKERYRNYMAAYGDVLDMVAEQESRLLALVADLRAKFLPSCAEIAEMADRFEAALRGGGGTEAGEG